METSMAFGHEQLDEYRIEAVDTDADTDPE